MTPLISVVIPHVPTRQKYLSRALQSVIQQKDARPNELHVVVDHSHEGPAVTRNRGLFASSAKWTLFLDDDDELEPYAISELLHTAMTQQADVIYPWFTIKGERGRHPHTGEMLYASDPFPEMFGKEFDPAELEHRNFIPVTALVNTRLAQSVGGFPEPGAEDWPHETNEDWGFWKRMLRDNAKFVHLPERLWTWHIHHTDEGFPHYTGKTW